MQSMMQRHKSTAARYTMKRTGGAVSTDQSDLQKQFIELIKCCLRVIDTVGISFSNSPMELKLPKLKKLLLSIFKFEFPLHRTIFESPLDGEIHGEHNEESASHGGEDEYQSGLLMGEDHIDVSEENQHGFHFPTRRSHNATKVAKNIDYTPPVEALIEQAWQQTDVDKDTVAWAARCMITMNLQLTTVEGNCLRNKTIIRYLILFTDMLQRYNIFTKEGSSRCPAHHHAVPALILACLAEHVTRTSYSETEIIKCPIVLLRDGSFRKALLQVVRACDV